MRSQVEALQEQQDMLVNQKLESLVAAGEANAEIERLRQEIHLLRSQPVVEPIEVKTELLPGVTPLLQVELASRLGANESTLWRVRQSNDFANWCRARDPDGIAWEYRPAKKGEPQYFPIT